MLADYGLHLFIFYNFFFLLLLSYFAYGNVSFCEMWTVGRRCRFLLSALFTACSQGPVLVDAVPIISEIVNIYQYFVFLINIYIILREVRQY